MGSTSSREAPDPDTGQTHLPPQREARTTRSKLIHLTRAVNKFSVFLYQELAKDGKKPGKHRYVSGYHRGAELYGGQATRMAQAYVEKAASFPLDGGQCPSNASGSRCRLDTSTG